MSQFIQDFRVKNPQYDDLSDDQLVTALHNKFYLDIPVEQFNQQIGFQPVQTIEQQPIQQQEIDGFTGAAMKAPEEKSMLELVGDKLENWGAGLGERAGDLGGALLQAIQTAGEGLEEKLPMGGFVWEDGDIIPSYKSPEEWAKVEAEPILTKGAEVLEGVDLGYEEQANWEGVKKAFSEGGPLSGSAYAEVLEYGLEQGIKSVPDMVATIYALPAYIFARSGEIGEQRAINKGKEKAELEDILEAAPFAAASALLERIGAKGMTSDAKAELGKDLLEAGIKEQTKRVAKAGGKALSKEAATEATQEGMIEYVGERYGTEAKMDFMEALDRAAAGAVAGGVFGGTIGTGTATVNEINYSPEKVIAQAMEEELASKDIKADETAIDLLDPERAQLEKTETQENFEASELWQNLTKEEQAKFKEVLNDVEKPEVKAEAKPELEVDIKEQPIDKQEMPKQEAVEFETPLQAEVTEDEATTTRLATPSDERADSERSRSDETEQGVTEAREPEQGVDLPTSGVQVDKSTTDVVGDPKPESVSPLKTKQMDYINSKQESLLNKDGTLNVSKFDEARAEFEENITDEEYNELENSEWENSTQILLNDSDKKKVVDGVNNFEFYHGSPDDSLENLGLVSDGGLFISYNENTAKEYAGTEGKVYRQKINIKNPFFVESSDSTYDMEGSGIIPKLKGMGFDAIVPLDKGDVVVLSESALKPKEVKDPTKKEEILPEEKPVKRKVFNWDPVALSKNYTAKELDQWIKELTADPDNKNLSGGIDLYNKATMKKIDKLSSAVMFLQQQGKETSEVSEVEAERIKQEGTKAAADKKKPKLSEVIKEASDETLTEADKVPEVYTSSSYRNFRKSVADQTATAKQILDDAENLIANKDKIIAEMSQRKFTKAMLQEIIRSPRNDLTKPQMVKQAYESMLSDHVMADATVTIFGGSKSFEEQIIEQVRNQTQADVDKAYEKQREYRAQAEKRKDEFVKALTNPETLSEFKEFIRVRGKDKMTAEQLAKYDELVSESLVTEEKPVIVSGEVEAIPTERAQTKHTKTGADLFVVKMKGRVDKDKFRELSGKAKQFGGYYSSYSKGEAIPGFQFKTVEAADQFEQLLSGKDIDKSDFNEAKAEVKQSKNADKLLQMAEKMENKANEEINRPRQANTARRASMAANATERAEKQLALAKTVRNIATRLQEGDLTHLGKLSQVTQLEELISIQKRAIPNDLYEAGSFDGYSISRPLKEGVTVDDYIANVTFPKIEVYNRNIEKVADKLKGKKGFARLSAELRRLPTGKRDDLNILSEEQFAKLKEAIKKDLIDIYDIGGFAADQYQTISRIKRLGITTEEQLRATIRELDSLKVAKRKADPVKALERDLIGKKIEGFFPTPKPLVDQMIDYADIQAGHEVLEPSAGKGNIAQEIEQAAPDAILEVIEFNAGLRAILEAKGYNVVGNDFLEHTKNYDRIVMNPPFENFQDIDHVKHAYDLLKPGGKLVAIMGAGVKNSRKKAVEFREWLDDMGSYIEDLPEGSFKTSDRPTGVSTVMVTIEKNDSNTLERKKDDSEYKKKDTKPVKPGAAIFHAPGHNFIGLFRSTGIPERREFVYIEGRKLNIPDKPQRIEPIISKLVQIMGRRIYFGKIKGKSSEGFYRPQVGEIRTRKKNDVEVLAHEMAHYLDFYSNITLPNFKKLYQDPKYVEEVKALSYTDADNKIMEIEGFAEFVRLWLTNSQEALIRAPKFYEAFTNLMARDRKLLNPMRDMQDLMHRFYFQGPDKLGQALIGKDTSFKQRFDEWAYRRDSRIRQQVIDRFHASRKVEQELSRKIGNVQESAWKQFRVANGGSEGISDYIMNYGTVNFDEKGDLQKTGKSLHEVLEPVKSIKLKPEHEGDQKIDVLLRYFAGRRALELHRQGRENLIPKETAKEWARLGKDYPVFESIQKDYQAFNDRMMDFYEEAGMITPEGRKTMQNMNKDYVPFNRIRDQLAGGPTGVGGGFQKLKGGTANLNDILVNIQDGITANVRAALNNRAKQRLYQYISGHKDGAIFATKIAPDSKPVQVYADEMKSKIGKVLEANGIVIDGDLELAGKDLLTFWQHGVKPRVNESGNIVDSVIINGKPKYYEVQDPLLQEMLLSMNPESYSSFMNVMFGVKNFFTRMITLGVEFTGANLVRDTTGAAFLSKNNFKPFVDSFKGMYSFITKDEHYQNFIKAGGGYSSRLEAMTKEGTARRRVKLDEFGVMTMPEKLLSTIDNIASAFEYGTRIGEFRLAKKNMKSDMDAGFEAREISTDFSVLGANRFLTGYIRTVPFLNAMIQSQDRVFREAVVRKKYDGNPTALAMKAFLGITVPTLILYLVNKDDEDYKAIPDYEKRTNWHIKIGDGQFVKIPRPYDVGFVYATMPELFVKYVEDDKGAEFADGMIWTLTQMYGIDGTPAMMTGWWDLVRNEKWTGSPVVPKALSDVEAPEQYTSNTSETFVRMGEALGISPIKAEHMFKAYTGYLGGYLLWGTDHILWDEEKFGEKPDSKASDNIFLRRFLTPDVRPATAAMEKFFDLKEKSDRVVSTFRQQVDVRRAIKGQMKADQRFKDDRFFGLSAKEKEVLFGLNDSMNQLIKLMYGKDGIKTAELKVKHDKNLTGAEKRAKLDQLWNSRNDAFMKYYLQADKALQKAKQESENFKGEG